MSTPTSQGAEQRADHERRPAAGMLWMALASALFAVMSVGARLASEHVPWPEVAASRALVGAATAIGIALARGASLRLDRRDHALAWARALCGTVGMVCTFFALGAPLLALGDVVTLGATSPIFVALLAPRLLGEKSSRGLWLATLVAFGGVALVAGPQLELAGHLALIATAGAAATALAMIWLRRLGASGRHASPEAIATHFSLVAGAAMLALSIPGFKVPDATGALLLLGTGLTGGLAQLAMTRAYALDLAARVGTVGYLAITLSHVLGTLVLGEAPGPHQVAGAALVTAAGVGLALGALRGARRAGG